MQPDPNWLFSATAQSAAAVFAIVGGFITTRILGLINERRGLVAQIEDRETRLAQFRSRSDALREDREHAVLYEAFSKVRTDLRNSAEAQTYADVLADTSEFSIPEDVVKTEYDRLLEAHAAARKFVDVHADSIDPQEHDVGRWLFKVDVDWRLFEWEFIDHFYHERRQEGMNSWEKMSDRLSIPTRSKSTDDPIENLVGRIAEVGDQIDSLQNELDILRQRAPSLTMPRSAWWMIGILGFIGAVSVVFPLSLLPSDDDSGWLRFVVVALFAAGLLALFTYIVFEFNALRDHPGDRASPSTPSGEPNDTE